MNLAEFACPVCGHYTIFERYDWEICPVCFWEDDVLDEPGKDNESPANGHLKLSEAQANYILFGCVRLENKKDIRLARPDEAKDPDWQPLPQALEIVRRVRED